MLNYLVCPKSNGRQFKTKTMHNMIAYIRAQQHLQFQQPPQFPSPPKILVIGWGSLLYRFGDPPARLDVIGEELSIDAAHSPLNIDTAAFKYGGPELPIEFSRISKDGRLTLVLDELNGRMQKTWWAIHKASTIAAAVDNLSSREGSSTASIGRVDRLNPANNSQTGIEPKVREWLLQFPDVIGAVWTALPSNFASRASRPFSVYNAKQYLDSLQGTTLQKAQLYISQLPSTLTTPLLDFLHAKHAN
jgi:hypothetical protein